MSIIVINFAHPLTDPQLREIETLAEQPVAHVIECPVQFDTQQPFVPQVEALMEEAGLSPREWQTLPLLLNLPSLNYIAAIVLALAHGRMGHFPSIVRLKPMSGGLAGQFEVAEIINLQAVRDAARLTRGDGKGA
ncbi:MAG: CRISPR-associated protein Csx15 [Anaerolineae bacterium]